MLAASERLTDGDKTLFLIICEVVERCVPLPNGVDLGEVNGDQGDETPRKRLQRLERAGWIEMERWHKHWRVMIAMKGHPLEGKWSPLPLGASPKVHWRETPMGRLNVMLKAFDDVYPSGSVTINEMAAIHKRSVADTLAEVMRRGLRAMQQEAAR